MVIRRQHYVPCCYLKRFSVDPENGRKSRVFLFNGEISRLVPIEDQAYGEFFYSEVKTEWSERFFRVHFEDTYDNLIQAAVEAKKISYKIKKELFIHIIMLYARSPNFENKTNQERIDIISDIVGSLVNSISPITKNDHKHPDNLTDRIISKHKVEIIKYHQFIWTSDNPVIMFSDPLGRLATCFFLMIDPYTMILFYRKDLYRYTGNIPNRQDIIFTMTIIRDYRIKNLYSPKDLSIATRLNAEMPRANIIQPYIDGEKVGHSHHLYDNNLSFLASKS